MKHIISIFIIFVISMLLSACQTNNIPKQVYIPVQKTCYDKTKIIKPEKPKLCVDTLIGNEKIDYILNCSLKDINNLEIYSDKLNLMICE